MQLKVLKDWGRYKAGDIADIADKAVIAKCTAIGILGPIGQSVAVDESQTIIPNPPEKEDKKAKKK